MYPNYKGLFTMRKIRRNKCNSFIEYFKEALNRLKLNNYSKLPDITYSSVELEKRFQYYSKFFNEIVSFYIIQLFMAPVIESLIVSDRVLYLQELNVHQIEIIPIFDEHLSPRNLCIVASKS
jgi:hypothetical protein